MSEFHPKTGRAARIETLLNASEDPILLIDASGTVIEGNDAAAKTLATEPRELPGKSVYRKVSGGPGLIDEARLDEVVRSGKPLHFEVVRNGTFLELRLYPILSGEGAVGEIAVYVHDLARRKLMEMELLQAEEMYRHIYENVTEGIFQTNLEGRFLSANPALARIHGFRSPAELIESVTDISKQLYVDPARRRALISLLGRHGHAENFEVQMFRRNGSIGWISISARVVRDSEGRILYHEGTMRDITKRKEAEKALRESEERYRTAVEHSNDGISIIREGRHEYVNRRFVEMFEYSKPEEIVGLPVTFNVHPDDRERVTSINSQRRRGEPAPVCYEFKGVTKTGSIIYVEVSATDMTYGGRPVSFVYLRDITERKRAEAALIESRNELERLNRAKSKAVDHISHELRTPLALVQANVRILRRKLDEGTEKAGMEKFLDMLDENTKRLFEIADEADEILRASHDIEASGLIDDIGRLEQRMEGLSEVPKGMLVHTRVIKRWIERHMSGSHGRFKVIDLYPFLESTVEKMQYFARKRDVRIMVEAAENPLAISMNPGILREVLEALIKNAVENTPDEGQVRVQLEERSGRAWINVIDTGVGITEENQAFLFDGLFHTTETDLYSSRNSYDFGAGGKGLELLKLKVYAQRFGFEITMSSRRCSYIPTDRDLCPGSIASCPHIETLDACAASGGSTFSIGFRAAPGEAVAKGRGSVS